MALIITNAVTHTVSSSAPSVAAKGDTWFDNVNNHLKVYNGSVWISVDADGTSEVVLENRTSDPASPKVGQMWIRTDL